MSWTMMEWRWSWKICNGHGWRGMRGGCLRRLLMDIMVVVVLHLQMLHVLGAIGRTLLHAAIALLPTSNTRQHGQVPLYVLGEVEEPSKVSCCCPCLEIIKSLFWVPLLICLFWYFVCMFMPYKWLLINVFPNDASLS